MKFIRRIASTAAIAAIICYGSEGTIAEKVVQEGTVNLPVPTQHIRGRSENVNIMIDQASEKPMNDAIEQLMAPLQKTFKEVEEKVDELQKNFQAAASKMNKNKKGKNSDKKQKSKKDAGSLLRATNSKSIAFGENESEDGPNVISTIKPLNISLGGILATLDTTMSDVVVKSKGALDNSTALISNAFQGVYDGLDTINDKVQNTGTAAFQLNFGKFLMAVTKQLDALMLQFNQMIKASMDDIHVLTSPGSSGLIDILNKAGLHYLDDIIRSVNSLVVNKIKTEDTASARKLAAPNSKKDDAKAIEALIDLSLMKATFDSLAKLLRDVAVAFSEIQNRLKAVTVSAFSITEGHGNTSVPLDVTPAPSTTTTPAPSTTTTPASSTTTTPASSTTTTPASSTTTTPAPSTTTSTAATSSTISTEAIDSIESTEVIDLVESESRRLADESNELSSTLKNLVENMQVTLDDCIASFTKVIDSISHLAVPDARILLDSPLKFEAPRIFNNKTSPLSLDFTAVSKLPKLQALKLPIINSDLIPTIAPLSSLPLFPTIAPLSSLPLIPTIAPLSSLPPIPTIAPLSSLPPISTIGPLPLNLFPSHEIGADADVMSALARNTQQYAVNLRSCINNFIEQINKRAETVTQNLNAFPGLLIDEIASVTNGMPEAAGNEDASTDLNKKKPNVRLLQSNSLSLIGDSIVSIADGVAQATGQKSKGSASYGSAPGDGILTMADKLDSTIDKNPQIFNVLADLPDVGLDNFKMLNLGDVTDTTDVLNSLDDVSFSNAGDILSKSVDKFAEVLSTSADNVSKKIPDAKTQKAVNKVVNSIEDVKDELNKSRANSTKTLKSTIDQFESDLKLSADKLKTGKPMSETTIADLKGSLQEGADVVSEAAKNATKSLTSTLDGLKKQIKELNKCLDKFAGKITETEDEMIIAREADKNKSTTDFVSQFFNKSSATADDDSVTLQDDTAPKAKKTKSKSVRSMQVKNNLTLSALDLGNISKLPNLDLATLNLDKLPVKLPNFNVESFNLDSFKFESLQTQVQSAFKTVEDAFQSMLAGLFNITKSVGCVSPPSIDNNIPNKQSK